MIPAQHQSDVVERKTFSRTLNTRSTINRKDSNQSPWVTGIRLAAHFPATLTDYHFEIKHH